MIRGVGPVYAKKLVRAFGDKVFDVIDATPERLREVDGIGPVRAASILVAWAEQKAVWEIMVFLHSHGVGTARAVQIFKWRLGQSEPTVEYEVNYAPQLIPISRACTLVWNCTDIMPGDYYYSLRDDLDLKSSTYAAVARAMHASIGLRLAR